MLAEYSLEGESEALGRAAAAQILRVALPLVAAVAEMVEDVAGHQEHGLRSRCSRLPWWRQQDVTHLDDSVGRLHAHQTGPTGCAARCHRDDGEKNAAGCELLLLDGLAQIHRFRERAFEQPGPQLVVSLDGLPEGCGVARSVQWLQSNEAPTEGDWRWRWGRLPVEGR